MLKSKFETAFKIASIVGVVIIVANAASAGPSNTVQQNKHFHNNFSAKEYLRNEGATFQNLDDPLGSLIEDVDDLQMSKAFNKGDPWPHLPTDARIKMVKEYSGLIGARGRNLKHTNTCWNKSKSMWMTVPECDRIPLRAVQYSWLQKWCEQNGTAKLLKRPHLSSTDVEWLLHHCGFYCSAIWIGPAGDEFDGKASVSAECLRRETCKRWQE